MESAINTLYTQSKYREALTILENASECLLLNEFEKHRFNIMISKAIFYCLEQCFEEAISIMESLINQGIGHAIPEDLSYKLNQAIKFICI